MFRTCDSWGGARFDPGASYEQSWCKSTRRCFVPNIKALHFLVSQKKNFKVFLLCSYVSNLWPPPPRGRASFDPRGIIWTILVQVHYEMLHTKYQSSALSSFTEPRLGGSVVSMSDSRPGGYEFDPRLRRTFFQAYFRLSPLHKRVRKVVGGFIEKLC